MALDDVKNFLKEEEGQAAVGAICHWIVQSCVHQSFVCGGGRSAIILLVGDMIVTGNVHGDEELVIA